MLQAMPEKTVRWTVSEVLDKLGMSTQEFADSAGISYQTALNLRRGNTSKVDMKTLQNICAALNVQPGDLMIYTS